ncbi:MAG: hypothetical protein ACKV2Q_28095 [Planctomycetaceae bacterium]
MKTTRNRLSEKELIANVDLAAPAPRLFVIAVDAFVIEDGTIETETFVSPVVSIRTTVTGHWARREIDGKADPREYADAGELRDARYQFTGQRLSDEMLVLSPSGESLISLDDLCREWYSTVQVVAAMWEPGDDEPRLAPINSAVVNEATKRITQQPASERIAL